MPDATALPVCEKEMAEKESWRVEFLMSGKEYSQSEDAEEHVNHGGWSVNKQKKGYVYEQSDNCYDCKMLLDLPDPSVMSVAYVTMKFCCAV